MLQYLFQANFADIIILIYMYIFLLTNRTLSKDRTRGFFLGCLFVNILVISDSLDFYYNSQTTLNNMRYILGAIGYATRPAIIAVFFQVISEEVKRFQKIFIFLLIFNAVVSFSSYFTHLVFYYDPDNTFHRGPLGFSPFLVSLIFAFMVSWHAFKLHKIGDRREMTIVLIIDIMAIVSSFIEVVFKYYFLLNTVAGVSIVFYYLFIHTQIFKRDALTHALNRYSFYLDLAKYENEECVIVSIDLNNLKQLNDKLGHFAGDEAIETVAKVFHGNIQLKSHFYRVGGDEFMMITEDATLENVEKNVTRLQEMIKREGYEIAWGAVMHKAGQSIHKDISESDRKMYEKKAKMKNKKNYDYLPRKEEKSKKIGIITDSASGIRIDEAIDLGIKVIPLRMMIGRETYEDDGKINFELFWRKLNMEKSIKTEPPEKEKLLQAWDEALKEYEQILYIPISSGLSEAYANAKEYIEDVKYKNRVFVIDVGRVSVAFRKTIMDTIELIDEGYSAQEIKYMLEESRANTVTYIAVESMRHLFYSNKVKTNPFLKFLTFFAKPVLKFDVGTINLHKICFNFDKAKKQMLKDMHQELETTYKQWGEKGELTIVVASSASEKQTNEWIETVRKEFSNYEVIYDMLPLVIASYVGAGCVGIGCTCKPKRIHN